MHKLVTAMLAGVAMAFSFVTTAPAEDTGNWIGTWTASAQPAWKADFPVPLGLASNLYGNTIRQVARVSIGGSRVRIVVSNEYGEVPLKIGAAHIGVTADGPDIQPGSDHALTFGGESSITIPPGAPALSDPVDLAVAPLSRTVGQPVLPRDRAGHDHTLGRTPDGLHRGRQQGRRNRADARQQADAAGVRIGDPGGCSGRMHAPS